MTYLIDYFDLNKRTSGLGKNSDLDLEKYAHSEKSEIRLEIPEAPEPGEPATELHSDEDPLYSDMARYWESNDRRGHHERRSNERRKNSLSDKFLSMVLSKRTNIPWWQQLALYSGIILGALISSTVVEHQAGTDYIFKISAPTVFLASVLAIIISPVAFEKLCMSIAGSFFTRLFLFIQNGVFWYVMLSAFSFTLTQLFSMGLS